MMCNGIVETRAGSKNRCGTLKAIEDYQIITSIERWKQSESRNHLLSDSSNYQRNTSSGMVYTRNVHLSPSSFSRPLRYLLLACRVSGFFESLYFSFMTMLLPGSVNDSKVRNRWTCFGRPVALWHPRLGTFIATLTRKFRRS